MIISNKNNYIYNQDLQDVYDNVIILLKPLLDEFPEYALLTYGIRDNNIYYIKIKDKFFIYNNNGINNPDIKDIHNGDVKYYFDNISKSQSIISSTNYLDPKKVKDTFDFYELSLKTHNSHLYVEGDLVPEIHEFDLIYSDDDYNNIREILEKYVTIPDPLSTGNFCDPNRVRGLPEEKPILDPDGNPTTAILSELVKGNVGGLTTGESVNVEKTNNNIRVVGSFSMVRRNVSQICKDDDCSYYGFLPLFILGYVDSYNAVSYYVPKKTISIKAASNNLEIVNRLGKIDNDNHGSNYEILWLGHDLKSGAYTGSPSRVVSYFEAMYNEGVYTYGGKDSSYAQFFNFYEEGGGTGTSDFTKPKYFPGQFVLWSGTPFNKYNNPTFSINHSIENLDEFTIDTQPIPGYGLAKVELATPEMTTIAPAIYGSPNSGAITSISTGFVRLYFTSETGFVFLRYVIYNDGDTNDFSRYGVYRFDGSNTYSYPAVDSKDWDPGTDQGTLMSTNLFKDLGDDKFSFTVPTYGIDSNTTITYSHRSNSNDTIGFNVRQFTNEGDSTYSSSDKTYNYNTVTATQVKAKLLGGEGPYNNRAFKFAVTMTGAFLPIISSKFTSTTDADYSFYATIRPQTMDSKFSTSLKHLDITEFSKAKSGVDSYISNDFRFSAAISQPSGAVTIPVEAKGYAVATDYTTVKGVLSSGTTILDTSSIIMVLCFPKTSFVGILRDYKDSCTDNKIVGGADVSTYASYASTKSSFSKRFRVSFGSTQCQGRDLIGQAYLPSAIVGNKDDYSPYVNMSLLAYVDGAYSEVSDLSYNMHVALFDGYNEIGSIGDLIMTASGNVDINNMSEKSIEDEIIPYISGNTAIYKANIVNRQKVPINKLATGFEFKPYQRQFNRYETVAPTSIGARIPFKLYSVLGYRDSTIRTISVSSTTGVVTMP